MLSHAVTSVFQSNSEIKNLKYYCLYTFTQPRIHGWTSWQIQERVIPFDTEAGKACKIWHWKELKALKFKVKKELQRGIVHWQPPPQSGENQETQEMHITWLNKESRRTEKDKDVFKKRIELTYAFRRRYLNEEKRPVLKIMREYHCLNEEEEVHVKIYLFKLFIL